MPHLKVYVAIAWGDYRFLNCLPQSAHGISSHDRYRAQGFRTHT